MNFIAFVFQTYISDTLQDLLKMRENHLID